MDKEGIRHKAKGERPKVKDEVVSYNFRHFSGLSGLVPICSNHIMFAHDLCYRRIEYL